VNVDAAASWNFDRLLDDELQRTLGNLEGPSPDVRQSGYQANFLAGRGSGSKGSTSPHVSRKLVLVAAGTVLLVGGGSVAATAGWGRPRPEAWGRAIATAIVECKDQVGSGQHSIGECVSAAANERNGGKSNQKPRAGFGNDASGAAVNGSAGPQSYPSPTNPTGPTVISGTSAEQLATPEAAASNGRSPRSAANQGADESKSPGQSKSPGPSKSPDQPKSHGANGLAANRGSGEPSSVGSGNAKSGGIGKPKMAGSGSSNGGGGNSRSHAPASPSPSP
jgi:hypothetical protein